MVENLKKRNEQRAVALMLRRSDTRRVQRRIVERSRQLNWRLYDLGQYDWKLPPDLTPDAMLTDALWGDPFVQPFLDEGKFPVVRLGRFFHPKDNVYPAVVPDLRAVARIIAQSFSERHFRHIGFIAYNMATFQYKLLYDPLTKHAHDSGMQCHILDLKSFSPKKKLSSTKKRALRDRQIMEWLLNLPKPVGIIGFNEAFSARICARSLDAGLTVPDQVAILSCGDDPLICECTPIQLSSIPALGLKIADATIALLQDLMDGHPSPLSTVFVEPGGITIRESTDVLATTCPEVALAVRFMWDNLGKGLSVDDIAGAINVPRRKLERAFRQQLGRGINAELLRRRLEYCCELLRSTDLPVIDIVPKIGFSSTAYLYKVFQRKFGMTPVRWRNTHSQDSSSI